MMKDSPPPSRKVELKSAKSSSGKAPKNVSDAFEKVGDDEDDADAFLAGGRKKAKTKKISVGAMARLEVKDKPAPPLLSQPAAPEDEKFKPPPEELATDADLEAFGAAEEDTDLSKFFTSSRDAFELVD